jgi:hypothetical protein
MEIDPKDPKRSIYLNTSSYIGLSMYPQWGEIFQICREEKYSHLHIVIDTTVDEDKDTSVYSNIQSSHLHNVVSRSTIFPCETMIKWIIDHLNLKNKTITNEHGRCVAYSNVVIWKCIINLQSHKYL